MHSPGGRTSTLLPKAQLVPWATTTSSLLSKVVHAPDDRLSPPRTVGRESRRVYFSNTMFHDYHATFSPPSYVYPSLIVSPQIVMFNFQGNPGNKNRWFMHTVAIIALVIISVIHFPLPLPGSWMPEAKTSGSDRKYWGLEPYSWQASCKWRHLIRGRQFIREKAAPASPHHSPQRVVVHRHFPSMTQSRTSSPLGPRRTQLPQPLLLFPDLPSYRRFVAQ
jgi:hypothetical protein